MSARQASQSLKRSGAPTGRSIASSGRKASAAATSAGRRWKGRKAPKTASIPDGAPLAQLSYAGLTRVSIDLQKNLTKKMDCRVKPGNDTFFRQIKSPPAADAVVPCWRKALMTLRPTFHL